MSTKLSTTVPTYHYIDLSTNAVSCSNCRVHRSLVNVKMWPKKLDHYYY